MDEKSMILEQERQQKAKKRKKYKKLKWIAGILVVVLMAGGTWYMVQGRYLLAETESTSVEIVAGEGQELVYAQIVSMNGNEITYTITDMPVMNMGQSQGSEQEGERSGRTEGMSSLEGMEMPDIITTYIPVGTEVTTKLGTITTFSRLAAGDYVALITGADGDEEIIMAVYIIG